ncbi:MAG: SprT-like domain-containing protein [Prevotella sp.]|nr:SprT-like domain-containing protein [Prevotella sp.]
MQIDINWIQENFRMFNVRYFDGSLPEPRFHVGHSRTRLGTMSLKRKTRWGRTQLYDFAIGLSNYYDQTEQQFRSVLLHEMIHLSIAHSGVRDTSPHGVVFRGMMERLNQDGWNISVTTTTRDMKKAYEGSKTVIREYLVLAIETADGRRFLSSVNPKFARTIDRRIQTVREIIRHGWYTTGDRWFEDMPKVRSLRGRRVTAEVYRSKTTAMTPIIF